MKLSLKVTPLVILLICITNALAEDWPQFLGPNRDGTSTQKGILRTWPEDGPEVLWTAAVGRGFGRYGVHGHLSGR